MKYSKEPKQPSNTKKSSRSQHPNPIYKAGSHKRCDPYEGLNLTYEHMLEARAKEIADNRFPAYRGY